MRDTMAAIEKLARLVADLESLIRETGLALDREDVTTAQDFSQRAQPLIDRLCRDSALIPDDWQSRIQGIVAGIEANQLALAPLQSELAADRSALTARLRQTSGARRAYFRRPAATPTSGTRFTA